jgi:diadenosine tetraphosphate (Ap4A) HIT family hydrolase
MKLKPVASEMLLAAGYDEKSRTLQVVFNSGDRYQYKAVPPSAYKELMSAESIGQYMHKHIIGRYDYDRIDGYKWRPPVKRTALSKAKKTRLQEVQDLKR